MTWQDLVFTSGAILFALALVPMLIGTSKPAVSSALLTGTTLAVFSATYLTLNLVFASATTFLTSAEWLVLAYMSAHQKCAKLTPPEP